MAALLCGLTLAQAAQNTADDLIRRAGELGYGWSAEAERHVKRHITGLIAD